MISLVEVEKLAFELPERERAMLASRLLQSLPVEEISAEEEADIAEALQRDREMTDDPNTVVSSQEFERRILARFQ